MNNNRIIILSGLEHLGYVLVQSSENKFRFGYVSSAGYILMNLIHDDERGLLLFQGIIPFDIPSEKVDEILFLINHINNKYPIARFIYNEEIKRVVVESSLILINIRLTEKLIENTLSRCVEMINVYSKAIKLIINSNFKYEEAYNTARQN
ncbi:MAG: hypothetical protein J7604_11490 [Sporocytophaga sp.]|uniref:hypothetical protein n=1 Tax=Sporocytophaga sp. TaxID=2231183 RepID=UPI001B1806F0|nr:hypothetical protein [Sporocytophaga sp.]MBO9700824.1 hypothetical protein [Sporocytophaga sp.]